MTDHPPKWPYQLWWCLACGEPCMNNVSHDPDDHEGGCGGPVTTFLVARVRTVKGTNGKRWEVTDESLGTAVLRADIEMTTGGST